MAVRLDQIPEGPIRLDQVPEGLVRLDQVPDVGPEPKTWGEVITHGYRRAGTMMVKQLAGLGKYEAEIGGKVREWAWEKTPLGKKPEYLQKIDTRLKEWSSMMLEGVEQYYDENPEEAIQVAPNLGYLRTIKEYVTKPKNLVQGIIESAPLILEGILGGMVGGPAVAIATMGTPITGEVYADARKEGTDPLPAMAQAILTGTGEAVIEQWTLGRKLGLVKNFRKIVSGGLPKVLWEGTKAFFRGTAEEGTQEFNRNFWQWMFTDRSQAWMENVAESAAAGGPMELVMAGGFSGAGAVGTMVSDAQKLQRVERIRAAANESETLSEQHKAEVNKELDTVLEDVGQGEYEAPAVEAKPAVEATYTAESIAVRKQWQEDQIRSGRVVDMTKAPPLIPVTEAKPVVVEFEDPTAEVTLMKTTDVMEQLAEQYTPQQVEAGLQEWLKTPEGGAEASLGKEGVAKDAVQAEVFARLLLSKTPKTIAAMDRTKPAVVPEPTKPPKLTRRKALKLGHELPKKLGWSEAQRRDFMLETVGKTSMKGMKPAEMRTLVTAMQEQARDQGVLPPEDYPKTLFIGAREVETTQFLDEAVATVEGLKDRSGRRALKMRPRKFAEPKRGIISTAKAALIGADNLSIPHLMRQIGAAAEGVFKEVGVTNWRRSQHHISAVFRGGVDMLNEAMDKAGVTHADLAKMSSAADPRLELIKRGREIIGKPKTKHYQVKINDKQFVLSMDELMDMYLASLQDMGPGHIESGGFEIRSYKTGAIDEVGMDKLRAIVEVDEKAMTAMNAAIKIADEYNAPQLNYTAGRLNPETMEPIADKKNYWHLEPKQAIKVKGRPTYTISLLENKNILKPRTGGKQPLVIRGFFSRFFTVQYAVSEYVGMAEELRLMNMILNNDQIIESLEAKGYTDIRSNLKQLLEWVQSKGSATTSTDKLLGRILHGAYRAVLHYSPEVIMSQYMSTGHYAGIVDPKYAPLLTVPPTPKLVKEMLEHNPIVWQRYYAGGQSAELAELGKLDVTLRLLTGKHADLNKTGIAAQQTDLAAFAQGWKIAKAVTKDTGIEEGTPEFWDAVNDKAEELWDTQPSWDKWNKSINTSQRGIKRVLFLFRSYFEKSLMMLHTANATYEASPKTAADRAKQAQVYGAVIGSQMTTALMRTFVSWGVWRRRKTVWDYLAAMAAAPFGMVAIVGGYTGRVVGNLVRILAGEKLGFTGEPLSSLPGQTMEDFLTGINQMTMAAAYYLADDEEKAWTKTKQATRNLIRSTGTMLGIPTRQIEKIIRMLEKEKTIKYGGGYIL